MLVLEGLRKMALNQAAKAGFAGVQRGHLEQMTKLVDQNLLIHGIEPGLDLGEELEVGFFRQVALVLREWDLDGELLGEREIDGKERASFVPLFLAQGQSGRAGRGGAERLRVVILVTAVSPSRTGLA